MKIDTILDSVSSVLDHPVFRIAGNEVSVGALLLSALTVVVTLSFSKIAQRGVARTLKFKGIQDEGTIGVASRLIHYGLLSIGLLIALKILGIDLSAMFAAGAIFAVGLGFAMQSIAQNFVAGVILLVERSIKPGDVLRVEGDVVKVIHLGIRATIANSRDGEQMIIPNSILSQTSVINYTLRDSNCRARVSVGVAYRSDMKLVRETLENIAEAVAKKWGSADQAPQIIMAEFGDNAVKFEVAIWMSDPWNLRVASSKLHESIWWAFQEKRIAIAFPQLDVHFDPEFQSRLSKF